MLNFVTAGLMLAQGFLKSKSERSEGRRKANYMRAMAQYNANVEDVKAKSIEAAMRGDIPRDYKRKRALTEKQRASVVSMGITRKSAMPVLIDQALEAEMNIQNKIRTSTIKAQEARQQGKTIRYEGGMQSRASVAQGKAKGKQSLMQGFTSAVAYTGQGLKGMQSDTPASKWWLN